MITFEQVEKLRKHAGVSYDEAKNALEMSNGDMLDAIILLEKQGKSSTRNPYCGYRQNYEPRVGYQNPNWQHQKQIPTGYNEPSLWTKMMRHIKSLIKWSMTNHFTIYRNKIEILKIPMLIFIILALWCLPIVPILVFGLVIGFSYSFGTKEINVKHANDNFEKNNTNNVNNNNQSGVYNKYMGKQNPPNPNPYPKTPYGYGSNPNPNPNTNPYTSPFKTGTTSPPQQEPFKDFVQPQAQPYVSPFKNQDGSNQNVPNQGTNSEPDKPNSDNPENIQL